MASEESSPSPINQPTSDIPTQPPPQSAPPIEPPDKLSYLRRKWRFVLAIAAAAILLGIGIPLVFHSLRTVSTDDAYVNSHVTFVAPRVAGQIARVLVDDNNRVTKGTVLVELDPEPYRVQVSIKQAMLDAAQAELATARATARSEIGHARSLRFKLQHTIENVDNQVGVLRARVATLDQSRATLALAQTEFKRAKKLVAQKMVSHEEYDQKREALDVANARVEQSLESVYQQRVALGLPREPSGGKSLADAPADLDQTYSAVRQALFELMQGAAPLGIVSSSYDLTPKALLEEFYKRDPGGNIDRILAEVLKTAPTLKLAQAKLEEARRDLDQAKLQLRYCTIRSAIDGVVTRRNVNPGNHVLVGQNLMAIRSLRDIWVDANFKETQLRELRIGQHAELEVDMYGSKRKFKGRISGFTMGTGSTLALLPPQNATGNFVKVVQRLPVRIDVTDYNPENAPLFVGLSVEASVDIRSTPTGLNAGRFLQASIPTAAAKP